MDRIIIIKSCDECPYCSQPEIAGQIWCDHKKYNNGRKKKDMVIPKWCPLDGIPEGKKGDGCEKSIYHLSPSGRLMRVLK